MRHVDLGSSVRQSVWGNSLGSLSLLKGTQIPTFSVVLPKYNVAQVIAALHLRDLTLIPEISAALSMDIPGLTCPSFKSPDLEVENCW